MKEAHYKCPACGAEWVEEQDEQDEWFGLGTDSTLCDKCSEKAIKEVISKNIHEMAKEFRRDK